MTNPLKLHQTAAVDVAKQPSGSNTTSATTTEGGGSVKRKHSLSSSFKSLFIKSPKSQSAAGLPIENDHDISPLNSQASPKSSHPSGASSPPLSAKSTPSGSASASASVGTALLKKPGLPTIYTSEETANINDIGFVSLNALQDENIPVPPVSAASRVNSRSGSRVSSRSNSKSRSRINSQDMLTTASNASSAIGSTSKSSKPVPVVAPGHNPASNNGSSTNINKKAVVQELGITIYEDGTHEHILNNIKALEKLPTSGGILSGFLRKSSTAANKNDDNAFSLLPEQNRLDFQKRLSMQSRRTNDSDLESDEDVSSGGEDDDDSEGDSVLSDDDSYFKACVGDNQLNLINKLKEKIANNEDPSIGYKNYKLVEKYGKAQGIVGKGAYGLVKLVSRVDSSSKAELFYAVKELKQKDNENLEHFSNRLTSEFVISNSLKHLNIVRTIDLMKTSTGIYSEVMEYCSAGDLYTLISKTNHDGLHYMAADCFFKQILSGVHYMHTAGVAHCDLKPENILLTSNGIAKISDFGTAAVFRASWEKKIHFSSGACGSEPYVAPEEFKKGEYDPRLVDVWSLGIMFLTMMTGSYAWSIAKEKEDDLYSQYLEDRPRQNKPGCAPAIEGLIGGPNARSRISIIYQMLDPNPLTRATTDRILKSQWVNEIVLCDVVQSEYDFYQHLRC